MSLSWKMPFQESPGWENADKQSHRYSYRQRGFMFDKTIKGETIISRWMFNQTTLYDWFAAGHRGNKSAIHRSFSDRRSRSLINEVPRNSYFCTIVCTVFPGIIIIIIIIICIYNPNQCSFLTLQYKPLYTHFIGKYEHKSYLRIQYITEPPTI